MSKEKTVYILGAGFSSPAGGPSQEAILSEIWTLPDDPDVLPAKTAFRDFLRDVLNVDENKVTLEDVYTPIDRCLADGLGLRSATEGELQKVRNHIGYLVSLAIARRLHNSPPNSGAYVDAFAKHLVTVASIRAEKARGATSAAEAKKYDPFAVISLNWDILLDNALNRALKEQDKGMTGDYDPFGVVDYCCYISSIKADEGRIRTGLWTLGCKGYNVKLLKIHGSMNWLQCPNCQQLFVGFDEKSSIPNFLKPQPCRHCEKQGNMPLLRSALVMPTFLKDLSNFQIKLIWQNAAVELMEARRLVFVGYSLPHADFEFRQVMSRMVHKDAKIDVVLWGGSPRYDEECERYKQFFSKHAVRFEPKGVEEFVRNLR